MRKCIIQPNIYYNPVPKYLFEKIITGEFKKTSEIREIIFSDVSLTYAYVRNFNYSKGLKAAEPTLMVDPEYAFSYAKHITGCRFVNAEPYIMKDPEYAALYAVEIMGKRWIEAEPYIIKKSSWKEYYERTFDCVL